MDDIEKIALEVSTFYHALIQNGVDSYTATMLTGTFITSRMQFGKYPDESPIIPLPTGDFANGQH